MKNSLRFTTLGQITKANKINIWYETFGIKKNPTVLLIMGGCCQGVLWHRTFCQRLSYEGFYVIRYDHRDAGLSTCFNFEENTYNLMDMTKDALCLLNALEIDKAHLFGVSLGGLLAEIMAVYYPEKVKSILLLGSTCEIRPMNLEYFNSSYNDNKFSPPTSEYLIWIREFMKLSPQTNEEKLSQRIEGWNKLNGQKIPLDPHINREIHQEFLNRLQYPQGMMNHLLVLKNVESEELVRSIPSKINVPTTILQGTEDPIFPPDHGKALSQKIRNSQYLLVDGMGHVPNDKFYNLYIDILKNQADNYL